MGILRSDRVSGLGGANAIDGSVFFGRNGTTTAVASGNWLTAYSEDDFKFGTGDFTIELVQIQTVYKKYSTPVQF